LYSCRMWTCARVGGCRVCWRIWARGSSYSSSLSRAHQMRYVTAPLGSGSESDRSLRSCLGLAASAIQGGPFAVAKRAGARFARSACGLLWQLSCQGGRRPVASRAVDTTSAGIGIMLRRVSFGRPMGTRGGGVGACELNSCTACFSFGCFLCAYMFLSLSSQSLRLDLFSLK